MSKTGVVFNIQRFSVHDGPGIRTTVFLKGCSLRCFWCHNPEGIRPQPELQFFPERCIGCGECVAACPQGVHAMQNGQRAFERERCQACGACAEVCHANALELTGRRMTVGQVVEEVLRDAAFYENSGGGVTLSGGDPVLQRDFSSALLRRCQEKSIHTAIETAASCRWDDLTLLLSVSDLVVVDIKHMDSRRHREVTGVSNERILANALKLMRTDKPVIFRIPVVPTVNDTPEEIGAIAAFVRHLVDLRPESSDGAPRSAGLPLLELLPFHRLAADKYRSLGLDYRASEFKDPSKEKMAELVEAARAQGIAVRSR